MRKLLIIGAGGHGRCCLDIARDMDIFDEISFLDDQPILMKLSMIVKSLVLLMK